MNAAERGIVISKMQAASDEFYRAAACIGNHSFFDFAGLINEYIHTCRRAHAEDIDFTECNALTGQPLPWKSFQIKYVNKKLECIFTGLIAMKPGKAPVVEKSDAQE